MVKILKTAKFETRSACDKRFRVELNAVDPAGRNKNDQMTKQKSDAFQDQLANLMFQHLDKRRLVAPTGSIRSSDRVPQESGNGSAAGGDAPTVQHGDLRKREGVLGGKLQAYCGASAPQLQNETAPPEPRRDAKEDDPESWQTTAKGDGVDQTPMWL